MPKELKENEKSSDPESCFDLFFSTFTVGPYLFPSLSWGPQNIEKKDQVIPGIYNCGPLISSLSLVSLGPSSLSFNN